MPCLNEIHWITVTRHTGRECGFLVVVNADTEGKITYCEYLYSVYRIKVKIYQLFFSLKIGLLNYNNTWKCVLL